MSRKKVIEESRRWLGIINAHKLNEYKRRKVVSDTVENFESYYNKGYLEYRKSVTEGGQFAAVEWSGSGCHFEDVTGRRFIDCLGGYGIYSAGINHPKIVRAAKSQLERMPLSSQELLDPLRGALAELLGELAPGDLQNCFFISNGTDAVEGAMKLARMYTGKPGFISCVRGFHGKSYGSLSLMGKGEYRLAFEPLLQDVYFVPFGDADAVEAELAKAEAVGMAIAAVVVEPVQGEAGAIVPPPDYWPRLRDICTRHGVLLIADEVQTGMGRTGRMFAVEHWDVAPDIICLGKALGGGVMPLSAFMSTPEIWKVLEPNPFIHSSTFGGNPARLRRRDRGRERHPRRGSPRAGGGHGRVPPGPATRPAAPLPRPHRGGARPGPADRARVRGRGVRLLGGGRPLPAGCAGRGHAAEREDDPVRAGAQHPAPAGGRGPREAGRHAAGAHEVALGLPRPPPAPAFRAR